MHTIFKYKESKCCENNTVFERSLAEVKFKAISQETRLQILSEPKRTKKEISSSDQLLKTTISPPIAPPVA